MLSSCGIDIKPREGADIVRFTPEETGIVPYSCRMEMIRGRITIADQPGRDNHEGIRF